MIQRAAIGMFTLALSLSGPPISLTSLIYGETATSQSGIADSNWVQGRIDQLRQEFPGTEVTSRQRTVERQAQLMLDRALGDRTDFLSTYHNALYAQRMDQWVQNHPDASRQEAEAEFVRLINDARAHGSRVSNHLNSADGNVQSSDIRTPSPELAPRMEQRIRELGGRIHREENAVTGSHWHIDWSRTPTPTPTRTPLAAPTPTPSPTPRAPASPSTRPAPTQHLTMDDSVPRQNSATSARRNAPQQSSPSFLSRVVDFFIPSAYAGVSEESLAAESNSPSTENVSNSANPSQVAEPSGGETLVTVDTPTTTGHIRREDSIEADTRTTVGDHRPGAAPDATVDVTGGDNGSADNSQNSAPGEAGNQAGSSSGRQPADAARGQQDFRDAMDREARDFQQSQQQSRNPGSDAGNSRTSYDENGNRADSPRGRYDADGNYTQRSQGGYDENGNRADSPRARYDANGNYIQPSQPGSGGYGQTTRRPTSNDDFWNSTPSQQPQQSTRQNRVYNAYDNTSRPIGSGRSNAAQQFQNIQQQSAQRIRDIQSNRNTGGYVSAPSVPFPTSSPSSGSSMTGSGNTYTPSVSSTTGSSGARLTFDDNAPRSNGLTTSETGNRATGYGYDESRPRTPAVTPRQSGTRSQTAGIRLP